MHLVSLSLEGLDLWIGYHWLLPRLSPTERLVLELLLLGFTASEIAQIRGVGRSAVTNVRRRIEAKARR